MDEERQDEQLQPIYNDIALKTYWERWTIEKSGGKGSGRSLQAAWHDNNDDDVYIYILHLYDYRFQSTQVSISVNINILRDDKTTFFFFFSKKTLGLCLIVWLLVRKRDAGRDPSGKRHVSVSTKQRRNNDSQYQHPSTILLKPIVMEWHVCKWIDESFE